MKVLFTDSYSNKYRDKINTLGYDVIYRKEKDVTIDEDIKDIEVLVCYDPFKTLDISELTNLKYIQLSSIGIDQVPKDSVCNQGITLCNNKGGYSIPMAEYIVMYILNIYKNSSELYHNKNNKEWKIDFKLEELTNKKVGFIGTGTIAQHTAKRLKGFDMEIYGVNTNGRSIEYFDKCFSSSNMDIIFRECDIVIVTVPSTPNTIGMINEDKFKLMKQESIFINVGRGNILNESDLINNIDKFKGVALDVFETEPLPQDNKLWNCKNVIISPHNSWISSKNNERTFNTIYENLKKYKNNDELKNIVDIEKGY